MTHGAVQDSAELRRILALPRRSWQGQALDALVSEMTAALRAPGGTATLRPLQAIALAEIACWGGAFVPLPVGAGKTLLMLLSPRVRPSAVRPLFLMPASLIEKTHHEAAGYRRDWILPPCYQIRSYEEMGRVGAAAFLESYRPDLIVADEAHYLKNPHAAVTRRVLRYLEAARPAFVPMTGTPYSTSLRDFAHLVRFALPRTNPLPARWTDLDEWARALDVDVVEHRRLAPGALRLLCADPLEDVRAGFQRRLAETPGVVISAEAQLPIPLDVCAHVTPCDAAQLSALETLRTHWRVGEGEDEDVAVDGMAVWRHARELSTGFFSIWRPQPPLAWKDARRAWFSACREILATNRRAIDSADQLVRHLDAAPRDYPEAAALLARWREVEPSFVPNPVAVWISDAVIEWAGEWNASADGGAGAALIWTDRPTVGRRIAARLGLRYYGEGGLCLETGTAIEAHDPSRHGSAVVAIEPNARGRNLQRFSRSLVLDVSKSAKRTEQMIGRTHRPGQTAARVRVDYAIGVLEDIEAIETVRTRADSAATLTGQPQKILHANGGAFAAGAGLPGMPTPEAAAAWGGPRWRKTRAPGASTAEKFLDRMAAAG